MTGRPFPSPTTQLRPGDECPQRGSGSALAKVTLVTVLGRVEIIRYVGGRRVDAYPFPVTAQEFLATYELPERLCK